MSEERETRVDIAEGVEIPTSDNFIVKLLRLGESTQEVSVEPGQTISDVFGATAEGYDLRVNGGKVDTEYVLADEDVVTMVPQIRAGL